jgi:hypothetical protein
MADPSITGAIAAGSVRGRVASIQALNFGIFFELFSIISVCYYLNLAPLCGMKHLIF